MPKKTKTSTKRKVRTNKSKKRVRGGTTAFPTVDNVIPYNKEIGSYGDPSDPSSIVSARNFNLTGGKRRRSAKKQKKMKTKMRGGNIFNYDLLTGHSYQSNAVQSLNSSSGTENTLGKITGMPQNTGPNLGFGKLPSAAVV